MNVTKIKFKPAWDFRIPGNPDRCLHMIQWCHIDTVSPFSSCLSAFLFVSSTPSLFLSVGNIAAKTVTIMPCLSSNLSEIKIYPNNMYKSPCIFFHSWTDMVIDLYSGKSLSYQCRLTGQAWVALSQWSSGGMSTGGWGCTKMGENN